MRGGGSSAWIRVAGVVARGHKVASGEGGASPYPHGTIATQIPHFCRLGLDLTAFHPATLNVSIAPRALVMEHPRHTFRHVEWTTLHPPEDFSFSPCRVEHLGCRYDGFVYYPHPETKARHFQPPSMIEVVTVRIPDIGYGSPVTLWLTRGEVRVVAGGG